MNLTSIQRHTTVDPSMSFSDKFNELEALGAFLYHFGEGSPGATVMLLKVRSQKIFLSLSLTERQAMVAMSAQGRRQLQQPPPKDMGTG